MARQSESPWSFSKVPNYDSAPRLTSIHAKDLGEDEFRRDFLDRGQPLLIRGACESWPAMDKWESNSYFEKVCGNASVNVRRVPRIEYRINSALQSEYEANDKIETKTLSEFFAETKSAECGPIWLHSYQLENDCSGRPSLTAPYAGFKLRNSVSPFANLKDDIGGFDFLPRPKAPRSYPSRRVFIGKNSYTDWHAHHMDEALMCQIRGEKEVLLLPPDNASWNALIPVAHQRGHTFAVDAKKFPEFAKIRPARALVRAGDALFIPVHWWHAVEAVGGHEVATVAFTFAGSWPAMFDLRCPNIRHLLRTRVPARYLPVLPVGVVCSLWRGVTTTRYLAP